MLAAVVAAAAAGGVVAAMLLSSGGDDEAAPQASTGAASAPATTGTSTSATKGARGTATTGTPASATAAVDTRGLHLPPPPGQHSRRTRTFVLGTVDDALAQVGRRFAQAQVDVSRDAGFDTAAVSATWQPGRRRPPASLVRVLRNVSEATRRDGMKLAIVVWHGLGHNTPSTPAERADFAAYADLLARSYDALKAARPDVLVLGGALSPRGADRPNGIRPTHSPTAFIRDLGAAYRASHRRRPLMDAFAFHPYMEASRDSPNGTHPKNTTVTIADYPKLVALLREAFHGTAQPGERLPIYYTEFGVQTRVPPAKRRFYVDLDSPTGTDAVAFRVQAAYYRRALELAYCQPTVRGLFVFHTFDEPGLGGWQSGLYFADRTPKPSLAPFKRAVADLRNGGFPRCRR